MKNTQRQQIDVSLRIIDWEFMMLRLCGTKFQRRCSPAHGGGEEQMEERECEDCLREQEDGWRWRRSER